MSKLRKKKTKKQRLKTLQKDPFTILSALKEATLKYSNDMLENVGTLYPETSKLMKFKKNER